MDDEFHTKTGHWLRDATQFAPATFEGIHALPLLRCFQWSFLYLGDLNLSFRLTHWKKMSWESEPSSISRHFWISLPYILSTWTRTRRLQRYCTLGAVDVVDTWPPVISLEVHIHEYMHHFNFKTIRKRYFNWKNKTTLKHQNEKL